MSVTHIARLDTLKPRVGEELAVSDWVLVDQNRINQFAEATGDHQWIHVDKVRAAQGPFGKTIAHGYLTLSLIPHLAEQALFFDDVRMSINYGLNRVRFPSPVPCDSRVRARFKLTGYEPLEGGAQITMEVTIEREGADKPACVAEAVSRRFT